MLANLFDYSFSPASSGTPASSVTSGASLPPAATQAVTLLGRVLSILRGDGDPVQVATQQQQTTLTWGMVAGLFLLMLLIAAYVFKH